MVLTNLPCDIELGYLMMDMTKVEKIVYEEDRVTVYWRVMFSDNCSTLADVGSVSFYRYGVDETVVTFHSAHLLATPLPVVASVLPELVIPFFEDHVDHYRDLVMH